MAWWQGDAGPALSFTVFGFRPAVLQSLKANMEGGGYRFSHFTGWTHVETMWFSEPEPSSLTSTCVTQAPDPVDSACSDRKGTTPPVSPGCLPTKCRVHERVSGLRRGRTDVGSRVTHTRSTASGAGVTATRLCHREHGAKMV